MDDMWKYCISILNENNYEAFLVGGAPRNFLLRLPVQDFDITTSASPIQIKECFKDYKTLDIGIKHGTVTVIIENTPIEITTYRIDKDYINHRHPTTVEFSTNLEDDCKRRDFTMNAICYHPVKGYIDFFDGIADIKHKIIRCIGNPNERLSEDALRILRAIRFSCQLGFTIDLETKLAILKNKDLLAHISYERIHEEFDKILLSSSCANQLMEYHQVLEVFIPEFKDLSNSPKLFNETFETLSKCPPSIPLRFICLIHLLQNQDVLKTATTITKRLKYPNILTRRIQTLLYTLNKPFETKSDIKMILSQCDQFFDDVITLNCLLRPTLKEINLSTMYHEIKKNNECYSLAQLAIKGNEIIALGYPHNQINMILQHCLNQVIQGNLQNNKEACINFILHTYTHS